jgi:GxxExxY protein
MSTKEKQVSFAAIPPENEELGRKIIGAAIEVHRILGPGFLESIYRRALAHELSLQGIEVEQEKKLLVPYKDIELDGQRLDLIVGHRVIVESKCVEEFAPIHTAQLISYLKTTKLRLGFLLNFKTQKIKDGIQRVVL